MITRSIKPLIKNWLNKNKVIIIYVARQVGKTTLCKDLIDDIGSDECIFLTCENPIVKDIFETKNLNSIIKSIDNKKYVFIDEAQKVQNIGSVLKLIHDEHPDIQLIATGSSSFELGNKISEPLTGRNIKFTLYPLSVKELSQKYSYIEMQSIMPDLLRFGAYPEVFAKGESDSRELLTTLGSDYLYRDVLILENLKRPKLLEDLLKQVSLQLGNEVTYNELAKQLNTSPETVERYIDLLEKCFVVFRLNSFSRNMRNELKKGFKVFFYDLGIRNSLTQSFNTLENRTDIGGLWENFCIVEKMKQLQANREFGNLYFWRSYQPNKEIDLIEEVDGKLNTFEFKWNPKASSNAKLPINFLEYYGRGDSASEVNFKVVDNSNWQDWLI
jgi:uncharacterized protein